MPRPFTQTEKDRIRAALIAAGKEHFAAYGLKKTNVADLTGAVGISKGAFYLFFESKEDLFLEILEEFEREYRAKLMDEVFQPGEDPKESFRRFVHQSLDLLETHPLFRALAGDELPYLMRRVPPERLEQNFQGDERAVAELLEHYRARGVLRAGDPQVVAGLLRALFFVRLHREQVGEAVYPQVIDLYVNMIADFLIRPAN